MAVVSKIPSEQVVQFAYLLQSSYRSDASTPKRDTSPESLRRFKRLFTLLWNGHFASWFYSSVFGDSSLSDTELGLVMMTMLSAIL